jgi:hypothetical protein
MDGKAARVRPLARQLGKARPNRRKASEFDVRNSSGRNCHLTQNGV